MKFKLEQGVYTATLGLFGGGLVLLLPNATWLGWIMIALASVLLVWGIRIDGYALWHFRPWKPTSPEPSAISVHASIYVDCDAVENENGEEAIGCYSAAMCLWVSNGLKTGAVLRNLQARLHYISGDHVVLPIRGSPNGTTDLRHGEVAIIEIARMLWRVTEEHNFLPGIPRGGNPKQVVTQFEIDGCAAPVSNHRSIRISNALSPSYRGIGQLKDDHRFGHIQIVISADDVVSKYIRMQTNLYADRAEDWLEFISPEENKDG